MKVSGDGAASALRRRLSDLLNPRFLLWSARWCGLLALWLQWSWLEAIRLSMVINGNRSRSDSWFQLPLLASSTAERLRCTGSTKRLTNRSWRLGECQFW